jgi:ATP-dependent DNA helicase RecG
MFRRMSVTPEKTSVIRLESPVTLLFGVGGERAAQLERLGIRTVGDLMLHRPARYEDRRHLHTISGLQLNEPTTVRGTLLVCGVKWFAKHTKSVFEMVLDDGTARLHCRWWNLPYMERYFSRGDEVIVYGKPLRMKPRTMDHPETEVIEPGEERFIHFNRITPVYPLTEGLPSAGCGA